MGQTSLLLLSPRRENLTRLLSLAVLPFRELQLPQETPLM